MKSAKYVLGYYFSPSINAPFTAAINFGILRCLKAFVFIYFI